MTEPEAYVRMKFRTVTAVEEAVRRYPEDPMAWYALGEWRMSTHEPWPIAAAAGRVTRGLRPRDRAGSGVRRQPTSTCRHCSWLWDARRRPGAPRLPTWPSTRPLPTRSETRLAALLLDPSAAGRAEAERMLDTASVHTIWRAAFDQRLASWPDTAETAIRVLRRLGEPGRGAGGGRSVGPRLGHRGRSTWLTRSRSAATCARPSR